MKYIKKYHKYLNEATSYHNLHGDDSYDITMVTRDGTHEYSNCDGVLYELSLSGEDVIAYVSEIEHTEGNEFYQDQIERYIEYIEDGGILETFAVDELPIGYARNLEDMCEYLGDSDNFDLTYDLLNKHYKKLWDVVENLSYDAESYGIDSEILPKIRNPEDLEEYYGEAYKLKYDDEEYKEEDGTLYWTEEYYLGLRTILEHWAENKEYSLTDMNHRFAALVEMGKERVYVDPS